MASLDLADIQGGILRAYGRLGFPKGRTFFLTVHDAAQGRRFVERLRPRITTASRWVDPKRGTPLLRTRRPKLTDAIRAADIADYPGEVELVKPKVAINVGFSFLGLLALQVPVRTLRGMPDEFMDGMENRAPMLGDTPFLDRRDAIWRQAKIRPIHIMVSMNAEMDDAGEPVVELDVETAWLRTLCAESEGGVELLDGNGPAGLDYQDMSAVLDQDDGKAVPTNKEHFGLSDGYGDPVFAGQYGPKAEAIKRVGGGKLLPDGDWGPLATGEFLLGYPDEAQEIPGAAMPIEFSRNGTFMAYRKLHENVASFAAYTAAQGALLAASAGMPEADACATVKAKLVGRWEDGVPLAVAPDAAAWKAFNAELEKARQSGDKAALEKIAAELVNFTFTSDAAGAVCPVTSHMRRVNPRATLGPIPGSGSALVNRRRILRRGLPYGAVDPGHPTDAGEHGIIFLAVCASLFRQFEFVQQQWVQYGLDFDVGSDTCPIVGNHGQPGQAPDHYVVPVDPAGKQTPFVCKSVPQFVEPRGGEYFFMPSMTALRMIGMGIVDPTRASAVLLTNLPVAVWRYLRQVVEGIGALVWIATTGLFKGFATALGSPEGQRRIFAVLRAFQPNLVLNRQLVRAYANTGTVIVARREDVQDVLERPDAFEVVYAPRMEMITGGANFFLGMQDSPAYTRDVSNMRIVVRRDDLPTVVRPWVGRAAAAIVAGAGGVLDVPQTLTLPVAAHLLDVYFGTPGPSAAKMIDWTTKLFWYLFIDLAADPKLDAEAVVAAEGLRTYLDAAIGRRKASGEQRDDILGRCLTLQKSGTPGMDDLGIRKNLVGLLIGELPTTSGAAVRALGQLLDRPKALASAQAAALANDDAALGRHIYEALRFYPLNPIIYRRAVGETWIAQGTLRARRVKAGALVMASNLSAMFDGLELPSPNAFRPDRPWDAYMLWGYGMHTCFGDHLNRTTLPALLKPLLARPNLRRAPGAAGRIDNAGTPFPVHLHVAFDA